MTGKVWLVGAGPGDPGLFTVKGKQALENAEVVVYDALVGKSILAMIPREAECINVGKRASHHIMVQEDINRVLLEKALEGKKVVRLKGGDPFLFGRGGEELELLAENGIPFEIVPGITSAFAVPAYNGIPVTHRDFTSSVHVVTGHRRSGADYDIDFEALVRTGGTLVFLMGISTLKDLCEGLISHGMDPDMPAAVLEQGTTAKQRRVVATVGTLAEKAAEAGIKAPAIIIVGKVCSLAEKFAWFEGRPLFGKRILVTRPKELISQMAEKLRRKGAEVLELPAIETKAIRPNTGLVEILASDAAFDWLVFTSPSGVRIFFEEVRDICDIRRFAGARIAAIGEGTAKELKKHGLFTDLVPEVYNGRALGEALAERCISEQAAAGTEDGSIGVRILIPRAAAGTKELTDALSAIPHAEILDVPVYDTAYASSAVIDEKLEFENREIDYAVFTSASTVRGFAGACEGLDFSLVNAVCIGRQTKAAADALGMKTWMSEKATMDSVIDKLVELAEE